MGNAFEELLAEAIARRELGDEAALATLLAEHPEHSDRLRLALERLGSMHLLSGGTTANIGEFRLLQKLGGGGMGVVYLAEQTSLRRKVALKLVRPELLISSVVRERFRREIETIAKLQHPGIAQVLAVGEQEGAPYFAMEYCPGCALGEVLESLSERAPENLRRTDFERAAGIESSDIASRGVAATWWHAVTTCIADVADTMAFVHEHRVIHRDLKPSNIIVTLQGRTKLLDFGLAHVATDPRLTQSGSEIGSPAYMAPEQLRGESVDERSDIYSLGVTLYQLLALRLPFRAKTPAALRAEIELGDADPLARHAKAIPRELCIVVAQAMDRDPQRRYGSMSSFARDLRAVLSGEPILARSLGCRGTSAAVAEAPSSGLRCLPARHGAAGAGAASTLALATQPELAPRCRSRSSRAGSRGSRSGDPAHARALRGARSLAGSRSPASAPAALGRRRLVL
jgi:serine/threonine protein kinase